MSEHSVGATIGWLEKRVADWLRQLDVANSWRFRSEIVEWGEGGRRVPAYLREVVREALDDYQP